MQIFEKTKSYILRNGLKGIAITVLQVRRYHFRKSPFSDQFLERGDGQILLGGNFKDPQNLRPSSLVSTVKRPFVVPTALQIVTTLKITQRARKTSVTFTKLVSQNFII